MSEGLTQRTLDLIPENEWTTPSTARVPEPAEAVKQRLHDAEIGGLSEAAAIAHAAATEAGLVDPRVTAGAGHVEIGLTDKSDSAAWIMRWLWQRGIAPEQVLIADDQPGPAGGGPDMFRAVLEDQIARRQRGELPICVEDPRWTVAIDGIDPLVEPG